MLYPLSLCYRQESLRDHAREGEKTILHNRQNQVNLQVIQNKLQTRKQQGNEKKKISELKSEDSQTLNYNLEKSLNCCRSVIWLGECR